MLYTKPEIEFVALGTADIVTNSTAHLAVEGDPYAQVLSSWSKALGFEE